MMSLISNTDYILEILIIYQFKMFKMRVILNLWSGKQNLISHLVDLSITGKIEKSILEKYVRKLLLIGSTLLWRGCNGMFCENCNEISASVNVRNFFTSFNNITRCA
jgi:hypothetical protein